jgi:hypothetical protein
MLLKRPCAALTWMKSYLNDRTQRVAVGSVVSNSMHLQCGVPQSYVLEPRLYCIFAKPIMQGHYVLKHGNHYVNRDSHIQ